MGLGIAAIKLNLELWQRGLFRGIDSVMDLGAQELQLPSDTFEAMITAAGISGYRKEKFSELKNWPAHPRCSAKSFYELIGISRYACLDLCGAHGAVVHDLNDPFTDTSLYGRYGLVTDYGNNEHAFNSAEAYRTMHRLCANGGLLIFIQNLYRGNGYYTYEPAFFEGMAAANCYRILYCSCVVNCRPAPTAAGGGEYHIPCSDELLDALDWGKVSSIGICYCMQKTQGDDFRYPYEKQFLPKFGRVYGFGLQFLPSPPSRSYLPLGSEYLPLRAFFSQVMRRLIRKFR